MARVRRRRDIAREDNADASFAAATSPEDALQAEQLLSREPSPSFARDILRHGLNEITGGNTRQSRKRPPNQQQTSHRLQNREPGPAQMNSSQAGTREHGANSDEGKSCLMAIEEEAAYLNACTRGYRAPQHAANGGDSAGAAVDASSASAARRVSNIRTSCRDEEEGESAGTIDAGEQAEQPVSMEGEDVWEDNGSFDEEQLLSPEEYLEMMQYIEEACREEDLRAEAEVRAFVTLVTCKHER